MTVVIKGSAYGQTSREGTVWGGRRAGTFSETYELLRAYVLEKQTMGLVLDVWQSIDYSMHFTTHTGTASKVMLPYLQDVLVSREMSAMVTIRLDDSWEMEVTHSQFKCFSPETLVRLCVTIRRSSYDDSLGLVFPYTYEVRMCKRTRTRTGAGRKKRGKHAKR